MPNMAAICGSPWAAKGFAGPVKRQEPRGPRSSASNRSKESCAENRSTSSSAEARQVVEFSLPRSLPVNLLSMKPSVSLS